MKKILALAVLALTMAMTACSGAGESPEALSQKIEKKETLTQKDYSAMIEYVGKAVNALSEVRTKGELTAEDIDKLNTEYPYVESFIGCLDQAYDGQDEDVTPMDDANKEKAQAMAQKLLEAQLGGDLK